MTEPKDSNTDPTTETEVPAEEAPATTATEVTPEAFSESTDPGAAEPGGSSLEQELAKYKETALRAQADFDNYRKRSAREREETLRYANARLLESLFPVIDNFELGMTAARNAEDGGTIVAGLEMVYRQLQDVLKDNGVEVIDADGQAFDPNLHEALGHEASDEVAEGQVLRQIRKGYRLRERLLRPANVIVSSGAPESNG